MLYCNEINTLGYYKFKVSVAKADSNNRDNAIVKFSTLTIADRNKNYETISETIT